MLAKLDPAFEFVVDPHLMVGSEEELRALAARSCARAGPHAKHLALRHLTIIGTQSVDFNRAYEDRDTARLSLALHYLMCSGVPVDPDFTVDCVDFRDGRDFLKEDGKTDLVFASYIRGRPSNSSRHYGPYFEASVREDFDANANLAQEIKWAYYHAQSPLTEQNGWQRRVQNSGAKFFLAFGGNIEVGTGHVVDKSNQPENPFDIIIGNPDIVDADTRARNMTLSYIYPYAEKLDLPMLWLGIAIQKNYGRSLERVIGHTNTFMARRILTLYRKGYVAPLQDADLGMVAAWRRKGGLLPALRSVLELKGHHIGLDGLQRKHAYAKRDDSPKDGVNP